MNEHGPMSSERPSVIGITWEQHRRTQELCKWLGIPLHELCFSGARFVRYARLGSATVRLLFRTRPRLVYVQNPSLVLALLVLMLKRVAGGYRVIMDAHNEAVAPFTHQYWPVPMLSRIAIRRANWTIVTNQALAEQVSALGGRPLILPDRLPQPPIEASPAPDVDQTFRIMVVATYAADEPIAEIVEAARQLGPSFRFFVTGRASKLNPVIRNRLPENVTQTGFLEEHDYWRLMQDSHVTLDLSLKPNCLVCGAYESLAMRRPMILTGNPASRDLFGRVALFPEDHSPEAIAAAIKHARDHYPRFVRRIEAGAQEFSEHWSKRAANLRAIVDERQFHQDCSAAL